MSSIILRLTLSSNSLGPFTVTVEPPSDWTGDSPLINGQASPVSNITREDLKGGVPITQLVATENGTLYEVTVKNNDPNCNDNAIKKTISVDGEGEIVVIGAEVFEGNSTHAIYSASIPLVKSEDLVIKFSNTIGTTVGGSITFSPTITILAGQLSGQSDELINPLNYNLIDRGNVSYSDFLYNGQPSIGGDFGSISDITFSGTPSPTPTSTPTPTPSSGVVVSPTPTSTVTPSVTPSSTISGVTPTPTVSVSVSNTPGVSQTATPTVTSTPQATVTPSVTPSVSVSNTPGVSQTPTPTNTVTPSNTPAVTSTSTPTGTPVTTSTNTPTVTASNTQTPTQTPQTTSTSTPTPTSTVTSTPTGTPVSTVTPTPSNTPGVSQTPTPTNTATVTVTPTISLTPSVTSSVTPTVTSTSTPTSTPQSTVTVTPSNTPTGTPAVTSTSTPTVTPSETPVSTSTPIPTQTPGATSTPQSTVTVTPSPTADVTPTPSVTSSVTPSVTADVTPTPSVTPSVTADVTPTPSVTSSVTPSVTPSVTADVTPTPSVTPSISVTPTSSVTPSVTRTPAPTKSPTPTVTPSSTPPEIQQVYFNAGPELGKPVPEDLCETVDFAVYTNRFVNVINASVGDLVFLDSDLATPFNGLDLWYDAGNTLNALGTVKFRINIEGAIIQIAECPVPPSATPTSTPTVTPSSTVTPTPSVTPSVTGTPGPTKTPTHTPTPSPSTLVYHLFTDNGPQSGQPLPDQVCNLVAFDIFTNSFANVSAARVGDVIYLDNTLSTFFDGLDLWYDAGDNQNTQGTTKFQINSLGEILQIASCPVPPSATPTSTPTVTPSSTPEVTVTPSVTPTNTVTPSVTGTPGPTKSPTPTVTPSSTPPEIQDSFLSAGPELGKANPEDLCETVDFTIYTNRFINVLDASVGDVIFLDPDLATPFNGLDLWYDAGNTLNGLGTVKFRINIEGAIIQIAECPVPPSATPTSTPTTTPTPTVTPTVSVTPSVSFTPTPSVTSSVTPTTSFTPTPTKTPTVTPSSAANSPAYLLIENEADASNIGTFMFNAGASFYGFNNGSGPTSSSDMASYMSYFNQNAGTELVPAIVTSDIPQNSGGDDSFGNPIEQYKFLTVEIPSGTVSGNAWYTWLIPDESIGGPGTANRAREIEVSYGSGAQGLSSKIMTTAYFNYTVVNPTGYLNGTYRVYTTYGSEDFRLDNTTTTIFFKGGLVS